MHPGFYFPANGIFALMNNKLHILPLSEWLKDFDPPLIISGPCSAENRIQLLETARQLSTIKQVRIFRAGLWKPRTRPGGFEGVGNAGLKWLKEVKAETGLLTAVEVARPEHVEACLKAGIDWLWIGARTTGNPFSVQEIVEAIKGSGIPVMVKNPLNPDLQLWIGALERLAACGTTKLIAVHRGFYLHGKSVYRNNPLWEIPIELKRLWPEIPIISDPSHISGNRIFVQEIAQHALDLLLDGLMIESHYQPDKALTDTQQQISPEDLKILLRKLQVRNESGSPDFQQHLELLRNKIDQFDNLLLDTLAERMEIVEQIGKVKAQNNISIHQPARWRQMVYSRITRSSGLKLNNKFILKILQAVHQESIRIQTQLFSGKKSIG